MLNQVDSRRQDLQIPTQALQNTYWTPWPKLFNLFAAAPLSFKWRHMKLSLSWHPSLGGWFLFWGLLEGAFWSRNIPRKSQGYFQLVAGVGRDQALWPHSAKAQWDSPEPQLGVNSLLFVQGVNPLLTGCWEQGSTEALPHSPDASAASPASAAASTLGFSCSPELELV